MGYAEQNSQFFASLTQPDVGERFMEILHLEPRAQINGKCCKELRTSFHMQATIIFMISHNSLKSSI